MMDWILPVLLMAMIIWTAWMWRGLGNLERWIASGTVVVVGLAFVFR